MMKLWLFFGSSLVPFLMMGQALRTVSGTVRHAVTNEPLAFSTLSIPGTSEGVVSNFRGAYEFTFSKAHDEDSLLVSMLGFKPLRIAIATLESDGRLDIQLEESAVLLEEVVVNERKPTALEIVRKVIEKIPENYPVTPYLLEGFSRSHLRECGQYRALHEAVFDLYGTGYHQKKPERVYLRESRQSQHHPYYHSRVLRANRNPFISIKHLNDVLFRSFALDTKNKTYEIDRVTLYENQLVYVIQTTHSIYEHQTLYIDATGYALMKVEMNLPTPAGEEWNPYLNKGTSSDSLDFQVTEISKVVQFEKQNATYYLKYMDWLVAGKTYYSVNKDPFCTWGFRFETMFTAVEPNAERPSRERLMVPKERKDPDPGPYHPSFWDRYPLITTFPITPQIVEDLEVNGPLEEQFKQAANGE